MTDLTREARLEREVEDAFRGRAHAYRLFLEVATERHGAEEAEAMLTEAVLRRGAEVAGPLFAGCAVTPEAIGRRFLSVSPVDGTLYPHDVETADGAFTIRVHACPLKAAWLDAGLDGPPWRGSAGSPAPSTRRCSRRPGSPSRTRRGRPSAAAAAAASR